MTDWREQGNCNGRSPQLWEPARSNTPIAINAATFCRTCPVQQPCYDEAEAFGRTDGIVQGGWFWINGKPIEIPDLPAAGPATSRDTKATARRRDAIGRYYMIRYQHDTDAQAYRALAAEYHVTEQTVREWHKVTRPENARRLDAMGQNARDAA